ncbi:SusF/SusE family outer membrane protein [Chryseobacterium sp. MMS23-Vi53]|uniref:SusF/SusE family outer membrane protein n=1 Tax=Chryseobacterium sp. MMS23-Vi53 TaxID=3386644 RepID=UPI0039EBC8DC
MKNIFKILLSSLLFLFVFSCAGEDDNIVLNEVSAGKISADKSVLVLNNATPAVEAIKFSYTIPTFDINVVPQYFVEIGLKGTNFSKSQSVSTTKDPAISTLTHKAFNDLLIALGAKPGEQTDVEVRFKTSFSQNANYYSNILSLKVTPFVNLKNLYLVGDATEAGWNNNNNNTALFRDPGNVNKFYFRGYFTAGSFKLLEKLGDWHPQWGVNGSGVSASNPDGTNEPAVFSIPTAGYYSFEIDINAKTYSLTSSTAGAVYPTIGIIGSSTPDGWNSDQDMTASAFNPHVWKITNISLITGEAKFRANNDWGTNWGGSTPFSGVAALGGSNIPLNEAGNYDVYFNDLDGRYLFIKK